MVARARAAGRAEAWAASKAALTRTALVQPNEGLSATVDTDTPLGTHQRPAEEENDEAPGQEQLPKIPDNQRSATIDAADVAVKAATELVVAGSRKRGRVLAVRAAERKRRIEKQEREAERELLVKAAEDEAERRVKR